MSSRRGRARRRHEESTVEAICWLGGAIAALVFAVLDRQKGTPRLAAFEKAL